MESFFKDLRYAWRTLLHHPGFTGVAVLSLALGIGANTAIFSFIDTVLLRSLPVNQPERLALFGLGKSRGIYGGLPDGPMDMFGWQQYQAFRKDNSVFEDVLAVNSRISRVYLTISGENTDGVPEPAQAHLVSGNFFQVLGLAPAAGRFFDAGTDNAQRSSPYMVLSDGYWERRFHRSSSVIGQPIRLGAISYTVLGVAPRGFFGVQLGEAPDVWIPAAMTDTLPGSPELLKEPLLQFMYLMGRMKPGVTLTQSNANVNVLYHQMLASEVPADATPQDIESARRAQVIVTPGAQGISDLRERYDLPLRILMIVVAMVLLIACANVANLLLSLAQRRQKEFALRLAIGADRMRIVRQLLTESLLLSACGGLIGILFANGAGKLLVHLISTGNASLPLDFTLDARVFAFTLAVVVITGILFGLAPAMRAGRGDLNSSLKEGKASLSSPKKVTFGRALVVAQVALSLGLLVTAGVLLHSFANLVSISTGFERQSVLLFKIDSESSGYKDDQTIADLYRRVEDRVRRIPGVSSEGVSMFSFHEGQRVLDFQAPGVNLPAKTLISSENYVSPGYFSTLHIPILVGRPVEDSDIAAATAVAVVSESFANAVYGNAPAAIGNTFEFGDDLKKQLRIVGVAGDVKNISVKDSKVKMAWVSVYQFPAYIHTLAVRVNGDAAQVSTAVRRAIRETEPNLPIRWTTTLAEEVSDSLVRERAIAQLSTFFAALALLLAAVGLYGTISFAVARRTSEIGIRMALGAERFGVLGMVLGDAMRLTGIGVLIGIPLSLAAKRQMSSLLYGLSGFDTWSVVGAVAALSLVAALAAYLPARRASRVDPMVALRYE